MLVNLLIVFLNLKCAISVGFLPSERLNEHLQVKTIKGPIQGSKEETIYGKPYYRYVGIPFARPPIYNLRFRGPKPPSKWSGVLDATRAGPCCAGIKATNLAEFNLELRGEEDCLYLNVFTPKIPKKQILKTPLPVMMYVYGGAFFIGCNNEYEPDFLIDNDVVVVIPNYRLGLFGYLNTEDLECPGNWAIKDLIAAFNWIKMNIQYFGGDPHNVTVFGQSAGAANVNMLVMSPKAKGLFHRAILMSGSAISFWSNQREPKKVAFDVGIALGIETNSTKVLMEKLRNFDSKALLQTQIPTIVANIPSILTLNGLPFTPTIEPLHKEAVLTQNMFNVLKEGNFNRIPIIIGTTSMEFLFFKPIVDLVTTIRTVYEMAPGLLVGMTQDLYNKSIVGYKVKTFYFPSEGYGGASKEGLMKMLSDIAYWRPLRKMSSLMAKYTPVYFYNFSYEGQLGIDYNTPYTGLDKRTTIRGAAHSEDVAYLFGKNQHNIHKNDMQMTKKLTKLFTNFAKAGNPTPIEDHLLDNITWPLVTDNKFPYLNVAKQLHVKHKFNEESFQFWENLFKTYGQKPYKSY